MRGQDAGNWNYACAMRATLRRNWARGSWEYENLEQLKDEHLADVWEAILGLRYRMRTGQPRDKWLWDVQRVNSYDHKDVVVHYAECIEGAIKCFYEIVSMVHTMRPNYYPDSKEMAEQLA